MSAFTDRLYLAWRNAQGKGPARVRRKAPGRGEGYPRHRPKPARGRDAAQPPAPVQPPGPSRALPGSTFSADSRLDKRSSAAFE
jgi:hypothetical protein